MKLVYWKCAHLSDADCYSIRERLKRDAAKRREEYGVDMFSPPYRVTIEYADAFDLMSKLTQEVSVEPRYPEEGDGG